MRNSRRVRPDALKTPIWTATEPASMTLIAEISTSSSDVFSVSAQKARAEPRASAPTSPMMIRAGAAFHHRKPRQPPAKAAANTPMSSGLTIEP